MPDSGDDGAAELTDTERTGKAALGQVSAAGGRAQKAPGGGVRAMTPQQFTPIFLTRSMKFSQQCSFARP